MARQRPETYNDPYEEFYNPQERNDKGFHGKALARARAMGRNGEEVDGTIIERRARQFATHLSKARATLKVKIRDMEAVQQNPMRYVSFATVFIVGLAVFALALRVDYIILEELWSRNFANEFFEVPASLQDSVTFKSLQVVFAVLAIHFFVSSIGRVGRGIYIGVLTLLVITMLLGVGLLNTSYSLPIGSTLFGVELTGESLDADAELAALGLESDLPQEEAANDNIPVTTQDFETAKTLLFFASFGLIFFFVSSVGALFLHYAIEAGIRFTGGIRGEKAESDEARDTRDREHSDMTRRLIRAREVQDMFRTRADLRDAIAQFVNEFGDAYEDGLDEYREKFSGKPEDAKSPTNLLRKMNEAVAHFCGNGKPSDEFDHILDLMHYEAANENAANSGQPRRPQQLTA